jgi:hypothetical protein
VVNGAHFEQDWLNCKRTSRETKINESIRRRTNKSASDVRQIVSPSRDFDLEQDHPLQDELEHYEQVDLDYRNLGYELEDTGILPLAYLAFTQRKNFVYRHGARSCTDV